METGVYKITNLKNGKFYIGSTAISFKKRFYAHLWHLRKGKHCNNHLQRAWNIDGEENFKFSILERCPKEFTIERENFWLQATKCYEQNIGYNFCPNAFSSLGRVFSEETKEKLRNHNLGNVHTEESKKLMSLMQKLRYRSIEEKKKWRTNVDKHKGELHPMYNKGKNVAKVDFNNVILKIYLNAVRAAEDNYTSPQNIRQLLKSKGWSKKANCKFIYVNE